MRIVIDLQGAQTESRFRGIGRYTLSFAQAVARNRGDHEVVLALSGLFPDTIEPIRAAFDGIIPQENIRVWHALGPVKEEHHGNDWRRDVAELVREAFLASLLPDVIHITSLFEGYVDDAVTSIGRFDTSTLVSVSLYDLIPLLNPDQYLKPNPHHEQYYLRKVEHLKKAAIYLAISEFSRQEALTCLDIAESRAINVSTAIERHFQPVHIDKKAAARLCQKFGLTRPFILYTGGADERKNLTRLIQAFADLPPSLREGHQLLLAGKMPEGNIAEFNRQAKAAGLMADELCFAGYVTDEELVLLYNLCQLFVFPSWHEGFGLPALEAMACGAPVIGANTSSLPEVIQLHLALFDPLDVTAIAKKMGDVLGDDALRMSLREHGLQQSKRFSWDRSARCAIDAWESLRFTSKKINGYIERSLSRKKLLQQIANSIPDTESSTLVAIATHIAQNQSSGVERQLILDVSELVQRDAATGVQRVVRSYLQALLQNPPADFRVEPVYATSKDSYRYARKFTQHLLTGQVVDLSDEPMQWQRGDIFYGLDMQHHVQLAHNAIYKHLQADGVTVKFLVHDLLPIQLAGCFKDSTIKEMHEQWLKMICATDGVICVSKATADALDNWIVENAIYRAPNFQITWVHNGGNIDKSVPSAGLPSDAHVQLDVMHARSSFISVATLEPRKAQQQILDAFQLLWAEGIDVNLVLVGQQGWNVEALAATIRSHPEHDRRLFWLQGISDEYLERIYKASTCLIAASINEGFGLPLIEAARHHVPIVARDIPVFREIAGEHALYFSGNTPYALATTLKTWLNLYHEGAQHPKSEQMRWSTWEDCTEKLKVALIRKNYPRCQLLIDISELRLRDARSGIQRVVRSILEALLTNPPAGYRVEPVYAGTDHGYRYAREFTSGFLGYANESHQDELIDCAPGDVFLGLDLQPQIVVAQRAFYQHLRRLGVRVQFVVYDLLCVQMPQFFPAGSAEAFAQWLEVVAESDGASCISKAVADELSEWFLQNALIRSKPFKIDWFHLGADVENSRPTRGCPSNAGDVIELIRLHPSFLMVGTIEPRKGHSQVLDAFERQWARNINVNLVIVGKKGWMVEDLIGRLRSHPELGNHLFLLEGISDEYLQMVYAVSSCLLAASYGEGFGLPLIEAAQHQLPIMARDIPAFREVANESAFYFRADSGEELANELNDWLAMYAENRITTSQRIARLTWAESAKDLVQTCMNEKISPLTH